MFGYDSTSRTMMMMTMMMMIEQFMRVSAFPEFPKNFLSVTTSLCHWYTSDYLSISKWYTSDYLSISIWQYLPDTPLIISQYSSLNIYPVLGAGRLSCKSHSKSKSKITSKSKSKLARDEQNLFWWVLGAGQLRNEQVVKVKVKVKVNQTGKKWAKLILVGFGGCWSIKEWGSRTAAAD